MDRIAKIKEGSFNQRLKFLLSDSFVYGGALSLGKFLHLFTLPILTRVFSKSDFGVVDSIAILSNIFILLVILGLDSAIARYYYEVEDGEDRKKVISEAFLFQLIFSALVAVLIFLGSDAICSFYFNDQQYKTPILIVAGSLPFIMTVRFCMNILKWTFKRTHFLIISLGVTFFNVLFTVFFIVILKKGIEFVFYAQLLSNLIFSFFGIIYIRKYFTNPGRYKYLSQLIRFGLPYMLLGVINTLIPSIDRYFISNHLDLSQLGEYAVAYKYGMILQLPVAGFQTAWGPFAYSIYKKDDAQKIYNEIFVLFTFIMCLITILMVFLGKPLITLLASDKYDISVALIIPILISVVFNGMSYITCIGIDLKKKTAYNLVSYMLGLLVSIITIGLLIKPYGLFGVAIGLLLSKLAIFLCTTLLSNSLYHIKFKLFKPFLLLIFTVLFLFFFNEEIVNKGFIPQTLFVAGALFAFLFLGWHLISIDLKAGIRKKLGLSNS